MTTIVDLATAPRSEGPSRPAGPARDAWLRYRWIVVRLGLGVLTLLLVSILVFGITQLLPSDAAQAILGQNATPERVAALRARMGLDRPPLEQYLSWMAGVLHGDFGTSLASNQPVMAFVLPRLANTLILLGFAALVGFPLALLLGVGAAMRPGKLGDAAVNTVSVILAALPEFVIGLLLVLIFATGAIRVLPAVSIVPNGVSPIARPESLVLPVVTLALVVLPYLTRQIRASLLDVLSSEYIVMAELKGIRRRAVITRHALRNALAPAIQAGALTLAYLLGGTVVVESIFQYPGIGMALTQSVDARDIPAVQAIVLLLALGYVLFNLIADVLTVLVTPKLRTR